MSVLDGATVLVTGGTGSFGRHITNHLLTTGVEEIRVFSRDEEKQLDMSREIEDDRVEYLIGDVRDGPRVFAAMDGVDVVFHAAALKIIDVGERFPDEVIKTNLQGTVNVYSACRSQDVSAAVLVSTDKACKPINLYGMTKAIAERMWLSQDRSDTAFSVVRYGNVAGSRGSVIPYFKLLHELGNPFPITHPDMTRFLITLDQAIALVIGAVGRDGMILVPNIPAARVVDIATAVGGEGYPVTYTGIRKGEKVHECLINEYEILTTCRAFDTYYILPDPVEKPVLDEEFTSLSARRMSIDEIRSLV